MSGKYDLARVVDPIECRILDFQNDGRIGMDVITEGVETEQQLKALSEMGCSHFQGYYFSQPIPAEEFETKYQK